jgi:hypothetical protein
MLVEIATMQRLSLYLGQPTYTLAVVLFVLLLFGSLGSRWFGRFDEDRVRVALGSALCGVVCYTAAFALFGESMLGGTLSWSSELRAVVAAVVLAPLGFLLGIAFPTGLRAVGGRAPTRVPWLWSVNSSTSVLGSVLATLVSLHAGIQVTLLCGAGVYLLSLPIALIVVGAGESRASADAA